MTCTATLHISVDTDLSSAFTDLINATPTRTGTSSSTLFRPPPPATIVAERHTNVVAQTVVMSLHSSDTAVDAGAREGPDASPTPFQDRTRAVYAVVVLDAQQVPMLLSAATVNRCPVHPSGAGPLGFYLDAVVEGVAKECGGGAVDAEAAVASSEPPVASPSPCVKVHLSLIVVPNATVTLDGLNSTNTNITAKEAALLFASATTWAAARQQPHHTTGGGGDGKKGCISASLDLCTTAAQPRQAVQMIAAVANKVLKNAMADNNTTVNNTASVADRNASSLSMATTTTSSAVMADLMDVRPDTQRKCVPTDFHALYTSMLTEVSSFSDRKTIAAVTAFPTMCHLLEYVDSVVGETSSNTTVSAAGVFSTNYGEQRSWNVLNDAIVEALLTDYRQT